MRIECLIIGYLCGCFLTAEVVSRAKSGKSAREVGSHNPGMANVGSLYGVGAAAITLAGDIAKVLLPFLVCRFVLFPEAGNMVALWVGTGATLGHDFPFWSKFKGGKGVTTTCATAVLFDPLWGFVSLIVGFVVVLLSKQLCFGAFAIASAFLVVAWFGGGPEALAFAGVLWVLTLIAHGKPMWRALHGEEPQTDLIKKVREHWAK